MPKLENFCHGFRVTFYKTKAPVEINEGINEGVVKLLSYIKNNPGQRVSHFTNHFQTPVKTLERWIKELKKKRK